MKFDISYNKWTGNVYIIVMSNVYENLTSVDERMFCGWCSERMYA